MRSFKQWPLAELRSLVLLAGVLAGLSVTIPRDGFWVVDCGLRYLQLVNIIDRHHFGDFSLDYPLAFLDPQYELLPFGPVQTFLHRGRLYAQYPPWYLYATAPFYATLGKAGLRVLPLLGGIALLGLVYVLAKRCGLRRAAWSAGLVVLATPILPYVYIFWDIVPALALGLGGQLALLHGLERRRYSWTVVAGVVLALAVAMREEYLFWGVICLAVCFFSSGLQRQLLVAGGTFALATAALFLLNRLTVGVPLFFLAVATSGKGWDYTWSWDSRGWVAYRYLAHVWGDPLADSLLLLLLGGLTFLPWVRSDRTRFLLASFALVAACAVRMSAWDQARPILTQYRLNSMAASAPLPFLALSLALYPWGQRTAGEKFYVLALLRTALVFLFVTLALSVPNSAVGLNFGPRLLLPIYPALMLAALLWIQECVASQSVAQKRWVLATAGIFVAMGLVDSAFYLSRLRLQCQWSARVAFHLGQVEPGLPIVTEHQWFATMFPSLFYERPILPAWDPGKSARLRQTLPNLAREGCLYVAREAGLPASLRESPKVQPVILPDEVRPPDSAFSFGLYRLRF